MSKKEKVISKQNSLIEKREQLRTKIKNTKDVLKKGSYLCEDSEDILDDSHTESLNPKRPLPSVLLHQTGTSNDTVGTKLRNKGDVESFYNEPDSEKSGKATEDSETEIKNVKSKPIKSEVKPDDFNTPSTSKDSCSPTSPRKSPDLSSKYKKLGNIDSKKRLSGSQPLNSKRTLRRRPLSAGDKSNYFPTEFMKDYCKQVGKTSFSLPEEEYRELMHLKADAERKIRNTSSQLSKTIQGFKSPQHIAENVRVKCFSQISQRLEVNSVDGKITNCYLNNQYLVIIQKNRINAFCKKDNPKDWTIKDTMVRLKFENVIQELIMPCVINKKETLVFCEVYLLRDQKCEKCYLKMAQYRFLSENGKIMKDFHLGSFDCDLSRFVSIAVNRRLCTIAVAAWAKQQNKAVAWIFTHSSVTDAMRCTPMIPVKHECLSLHDVSVVSTKTLMLGFGCSSFTVWNGKSGERFIFVNMHKLAPLQKLTCHLGVFAVVQKGFLFLVVSGNGRIHMVAVNMGTGLYRSLRQFQLPKDQICLEAIVKDDRLVAITDKAILCYSLYNSYKLQHLKIEQEDTAYAMKKKLLIMSAYKFKRIYYLKSVDEMIGNEKTRRRFRRPRADSVQDLSDTSTVTSSEYEGPPPQEQDHLEDSIVSSGSSQ